MIPIYCTIMINHIILAILVTVMIVSLPFTSSAFMAAAQTSPNQTSLTNVTQGPTEQEPQGLAGVNVTEGPPGPQGPPGSQGPAGDTRQTIITLHDDAEGNAAGWNPPTETSDFFVIKTPVELKPGFSLEATFTNPPQNGFMFVGPCFISGTIDISTNTHWPT